MIFSTTRHKAGETISRELNLMWRVALTLTRDGEAAEELVQETCVRALRNPAPLVRHPNPRAYLLVILRNLQIDLVRQNQRAPNIISISQLADPSQITNTAAPTSNEPHHLIRDSLDAEVHQALHSLDEDLRTTLWLREVEEMTYHEIAEAMEAPVGTVKSRIARARAHLARLLLGSQARPSNTETNPNSHEVQS
jgi:RNA polymerase sigma-70 factor (ECF subfamily)